MMSPVLQSMLKIYNLIQRTMEGHRRVLSWKLKYWICTLEGLHWLYFCRTEGRGKDQSKVVNYEAGEVFKKRDVGCLHQGQC